MFKSYEEFSEAIKKCGIKALEAEYAKGTAAPNIVYFRSADRGIYANGALVLPITQIVVELYTDRNDNKSEKMLQHWLTENEIYFQKTERVWLTSEKWYMTVYEFELIFDE